MRRHNFPPTYRIKKERRKEKGGTRKGPMVGMSKEEGEKKKLGVKE
jgi:hypothetical protein